MERSQEVPQKRVTIHEAFPTLPSGKEAEAEARLVRYAALAFRIYERLRKTPEKYSAFQRRLTELSTSDSMTLSGERGSPAPPTS